jgi:carboxymethylenebutenolidase
MRRLLPCLALSLALTSGACRATLPASRLETTPRHDEWVQVRAGDRTVHTYVVYPQRSDRALAVVLIHENRGLTDWVRTVADSLAAEGYIALAPDLLSGMAPGGGRTSDFATQDAAREAIGRLPPQQVAADLRAVLDHARAIPAANGRVAVAGFCWGGSRVWDVAATGADLAAAFVFYGTGPADSARVAPIRAPVYGFYGGDDARVNATIPATAEAMLAAGRRFEPETYPGAGHAYMRATTEPTASAANREAASRSWERWLRLLGAASGGF